MIPRPNTTCSDNSGRDLSNAANLGTGYLLVTIDPLADYPHSDKPEVLWMIRLYILLLLELCGTAA